MLQKTKCYSLIIFLIMPHYFEASPSCTQPVAKVVSVQGKVDRQYSGHSEWQIVLADDSVCSGDKIRTEKWSRATLILSNDSLVTLDQSTTLVFSEPEENNSTWLLKLIGGSAFFRSREPQRLNIQTPFINAVHKGTEFLVTVDGLQTTISVFDGQVAGENKSGRIQIKKGFSGIAQQHQPPRLQALTITPEDAVQWTLYYPPVIDYPHQTSSLSVPNLKPALAAYQQGDAYQALVNLDDVPVSNQDADYLTLKASLLLTVGRVDEASDYLNRSLRIRHDHSIIFALQAIIAVAKNQQQTALNLALKAVTLNPKSSVAKIALSYAYQSMFKIKEALIVTQEATQITSDNALAWARLSELQLSMGDHLSALVSARKAQNLNPTLASTQTILGFADLARFDFNAGKKAFEQAIALDSSYPLARLGLGLAKIRTGALEEGKKDLETAVNIDPDNAVIRSYLGKVYYELRNKDYAGAEYKIAKEMDPKDPTPWFYDAILKQTINRPVEALHDMQKAIELNDNRAVYRSSLLLDKDLAARSAGLGRIYNDLGFQRLGLVEGWKSVNTDPSNYSAHRLLADNYASQPRHEIARVSELLQSQLLQPINITPIQAQLAQSNILIVDGLGPSSLSFNEYNPLFARNRFALQTSGIYGSNNTWGEDVAHSGLWDKGSYSLGQFHYETDGYRENNFLKQDIYNAFVQGNITDSLNLQAEYRHEERKNGDLSVNFDKKLFSADLIENRNIDTYRIGGRYAFSPHASLMGSLIYQQGNFQTQTPDVATTQLNRRGFISELQHHYTDSQFNSITGFGYINQVSKTIITPQDEFEAVEPILKNQDITKTTLYNYSNISLTDKLRATLGISYDAFKFERDINKNPINPKLGLIWNPLASTTFRAAFFRSMNITRFSNQTIEPTQVAGFNQFFDDINGTVAWRYGAAVDHVFSKQLSAGLEFSERRLDVPSFGFSSFNWNEQLGRAYVYVTPWYFSSLGLEYFYERFDRKTNPLGGGIVDVTTQWLPLTLNVFHASGLSLLFKTTYVKQNGVFDNIGQPYNGSSDFFIFDLNINYRLPSRYGMLSLGVKNLFDNRFQYQSTNQVNSNETLFAPEMTLFTQVKLAF